MKLGIKLKMKYKMNLGLVSSVAKNPLELDWPNNLIETSVKELCLKAGLRYRVTGGLQPKLLLDHQGNRHYKTRKNDEAVYIVGCQSIAPNDPERSIRLLEILAHAFHDYAARECVCGKGLFC